MRQASPPILVFASAALLSASFTGGAATQTETTMAQDAIPLAFRLGEPLADFARRNPRIGDIAAHAGREDDGIVAFTASAEESPEGPGYALAYSDGDCTATLPAGRYVQFSQSAGFITSASQTLPLQLLSFDEAMGLARRIAAEFDRAGWPRRRDRMERITEETFGSTSVGGRFEQVAFWTPCDRPSFSASLTIHDYDSMPSAPLVPLLPGRPDDPDLDTRYVLEVFFQVEDLLLTDEAQALRDARRRDVNRDETAPLLLQEWLADPGWRSDGWRGTLIP